MPLVRQFQTYYVINLNHYAMPWGGSTYSKIMTKDFPSEYLVADDYTLDGTKAAAFLHPVSVLNAYYIDGLAEGHFSIYNESTVTAFAVTAYVATLKKTPDVPGAASTLGAYSGSISSDNDVLTEDYFTLPILINVDHELVEAAERLILELSYTCATDTFNATGIAHANDSANIDGQIKVPFAPEGG